MSGTLDGKVARITGGGTGFGLATAREFAQEGAEVYITGRRKRELDAAAAATGRLEEVAKTVTSLASDDASYITGDEVFVDGGAGQV
ncbi:MAG TPA: SDR family oxidoreductase [Streptosporangiaceae bacterium]|jgi:NAD(P)-dependent dehydrogenase (short-subunit alcohol dehydrogenase family)